MSVFLRKLLLGQNWYLTKNSCNVTFITELGHWSQHMECVLYDANLPLSKTCTYLLAMGSSGLLEHKGWWAAALLSRIGAWGSYRSVIFEER